MIFLDASVLIAAAHVSHERHSPSRELWSRCARNLAAISAQTIAEVYDTLTAMPPAMRLSPRNAGLALESFLKRLTPVTLTAEEYLDTLRRTASLGHSGDTIYDALHLACARKVRADQIYTWNVRHFRAVAPDLADRIVTP